MVASIGAVASSAQGASYYERDGYYAKDDPEHLRLSAWAGRGAAELGLEGAVDPDVFRAVLEGKVPDGSGRQLGRRGKDGEIQHRPGRDLTLSAPKSVSLAALVGGDARVTEAHERAPDHDARMHSGAVHRALEQLLVRDGLMTVVEEDGDEDLVAAPAKAGLEVTPGVSRRGERTVAPQPRRHPPGVELVEGTDRTVEASDASCGMAAPASTRRGAAGRTPLQRPGPRPCRAHRSASSG